MKKNLTFIILLLFPVLTLKSIEITRGPYVEAARFHSAVVRWNFNKKEISWFQYGPAPKCDRMMTIMPENHKNTLHLYGLSSGVKYCYRIFAKTVENEEDKSIRLAEGSFKTLKPAGKNKFNFLLFGKSGTNSDTPYELAKATEEFDYDFVVHTGDIVNSGLNADADEQYFTPFSKIMKKAPFFLTMGISAYGQDPINPESKMFVRRNYKNYHTMPWSQGSPYYYYFDNANARFIFLDAASIIGIPHGPDLDLESRQLEWLKNTLRKSRGIWKFVFINVPLYSTGSYPSNEKLAVLLEPIFQRYGVDIVFQGYNANYERTFQIKNGEKVERGGIVYITSGGGGVPLEGQSTDAPWSDIFKKKHHFSLIEVKGRKFKMTVYDLDKEPIDILEIVR